MPTKAIFHFENHEKAAKNKYWELFFKPRLIRAGLLPDTQFCFQDYVDRKSPLAGTIFPAGVARKAIFDWDKFDPSLEKTVWILDLDAEGVTRTDSSYGLCVLIDLAKESGLSIQEFLENRFYLTVILTHFPEQLLREDGIIRLPKPHRCDLSLLGKLWPHITKVTQLQYKEIKSALANVNNPGPRILWANSGIDDAWMSDVVVSWIQ